MYTLQSFKVPMVHLSPGWTEGPVKIKKPEGKDEREAEIEKVEGSHINLNASMCHFQCKIEVISTSTELTAPPTLSTQSISRLLLICVNLHFTSGIEYAVGWRVERMSSWKFWRAQRVMGEKT